MIYTDFQKVHIKRRLFLGSDNHNLRYKRSALQKMFSSGTGHALHISQTLSCASFLKL